MKKIFLLFFSLVIILCGNNAYAEITHKNMELECIYANGVAVTMSYDEKNDYVNLRISDYPVSKTTEIKGEAFPNYSLFDCEGSCANSNHNIEMLKSLSCPDHINVWRISTMSREDDDSEWQITTKGIYSFKAYTNNGTETISSYYGNDTGKDNGTGWWIFGTAPTNKTRVLPINGTNLYGVGNAYPNSNEYYHIKISLVAERLYVVGDLKDNDYSVSYKSSANQAIGQTSYVQFLKKGDRYFAKKGKIITEIKSNTGTIKKDYLCFKESVTEEDSSRSDSSYKFSSVRHGVKAPTKSGNKYTCSSGYTLYTLNDKICKISAEDRKKSFCDEYGNTAVVLIQIIQIMQILVPALVIILTGIDIAKIVLAGNIEEELPKKKKTMIVRMIVMVTFFFLPLITKVVIDLLADKDIYDVSCLFNNGVQVKGTEENCVE